LRDPFGILRWQLQQKEGEPLGRFLPDPRQNFQFGDKT
jgi:hypothetical protein